MLQAATSSNLKTTKNYRIFPTFNFFQTSDNPGIILHLQFVVNQVTSLNTRTRAAQHSDFIVKQQPSSSCDNIVNFYSIL